MLRFYKCLLALILCIALSGGSIPSVSDAPDIEAACQSCKVSGEKGKLIRIEPYHSKPVTKGDKRTRICVLMGVYKKGNKIYRRCYKYKPIGYVTAKRPVVAQPRKVVSHKYLLQPTKGVNTFMFTAMNAKPKKNAGKLNYTTYIPWNGSAQFTNTSNPGVKPKNVLVYLQRIAGKQWKTVAHSGINMNAIPKSTPYFCKEYGGRNLIMGVNYRFMLKSTESKAPVYFNIGVGNAHPVDVPNLKF